MSVHVGGPVIFISISMRRRDSDGEWLRKVNCKTAVIKCSFCVHVKCSFWQCEVHKNAIIYSLEIYFMFIFNCKRGFSGLIVDVVLWKRKSRLAREIWITQRDTGRSWNNFWYLRVSYWKISFIGCVSWKYVLNIKLYETVFIHYLFILELMRVTGNKGKFTQHKFKTIGTLFHFSYELRITFWRKLSSLSFVFVKYEHCINLTFLK